MALRRQGLSQRRKAVGFTQESLAEHLGVERSTVVRWEAGDTEPLPAIRPKVARALQVSIDQLAELLTESENADTTRALSTDTEVTIPVLLPEVRPGRVELKDLIPQVADSVEALRRALRSAGVVPEDLDAMLLAGRSSRVPLVSAEPGRPVVVDADPQAGFAGVDVPAPARTEVPQRPSLTAIPLDVGPADVQRRRARSRRFNRFAVAGALALAFAGGAASVLFITSHSGPIPQAAAGTPAPATTVVATPAPNPGSSNDNNSRSKDTIGAVHTAPATAPNTSADGTAPPIAAAVPAPHTIRSDNRTTSRSTPPASTTTPALPRTPAIPAEAYTWSQAAALSASEQRMTRLRPGALPHP